MSPLPTLPKALGLTILYLRPIHWHARGELFETIIENCYIRHIFAIFLAELHYCWAWIKNVQQREHISHFSRRLLTFTKISCSPFRQINEQAILAIFSLHERLKIFIQFSRIVFFFCLYQMALSFLIIESIVVIVPTFCFHRIKLPRLCRNSREIWISPGCTVFSHFRCYFHDLAGYGYCCVLLLFIRSPCTFSSNVKQCLRTISARMSAAAALCTVVPKWGQSSLAKLSDNSFRNPWWKRLVSPLPPKKDQPRHKTATIRQLSIALN